MQKYSDQQNASGMKVLFMFVQMIVLTVVYIIVYTSFRAVGFAVEKYAAGIIMYVPVVMALAVFPVLLYNYRKMFNAGRRMLATIWTMSTASLTIVLLYLYVVQIAG